MFTLEGRGGGQRTIITHSFSEKRSIRSNKYDEPETLHSLIISIKTVSLHAPREQERKRRKKKVVIMDEPLFQKGIFKSHWLEFMYMYTNCRPCKNANSVFPVCLN